MLILTSNPCATRQLLSQQLTVCCRQQVLGVTLVAMTPSRGFCAELATSLVISLASVYGLPVSTTQVLTIGEGWVWGCGCL
jgi:hypothetical protein